MMRALRILIIAFIFITVEVIITACCESFSYTIDGLIVQNLANEEVTSVQDIEKSVYGIEVNLLSHKYDGIVAYSANNANACDCFSQFRHNMIIDLRIKALEPGTTTATDVTNEFMGIVWNEHQYNEYVNIGELINQVNGQGEYTNDLHLKPLSSLPVEGYLEFIVEITLENSQKLTDTTNVVRIY